jgi:hypothetical protein
MYTVQLKNKAWRKWLTSLIDTVRIVLLIQLRIFAWPHVVAGKEEQVICRLYWMILKKKRSGWNLTNGERQGEEPLPTDMSYKCTQLVTFYSMKTIFRLSSKISWYSLVNNCGICHLDQDDQCIRPDMFILQTINSIVMISVIFYLSTLKNIVFSTTKSYTL